MIAATGGAAGAAGGRLDMARECHIGLAFSSGANDARAMQLPETIVFDLDGTLVDSAPDLTAALNAALADLGREPVDPPTVRHLAGHGARVLIERGLALRGGGGEAEVARALPVFLTYYGAHIADTSLAYPGAEAALNALAAAGCRLAICTNKPVALAQALVAALGWSGRFAAILGGDSLAVRKPDPAPLLATIAAAGGDPATTVYVGDTDVDVATARAAGVPVVVAGFGFASGPPSELGGDAVIDHFDALLPVLAALQTLPTRDAA